MTTDLLNACMSDLKESNAKAFGETFCKRCRNAECCHSQGLNDKFRQRVSTQVDRLFHSPQADPRHPKYAMLADFKDMLDTAIRLETADRRGDWEVPEIPILDGRTERAQVGTTTAVDDAAQTLARVRGQEMTLPAVPENPPAQVDPEPPKQPEPPPSPPTGGGLLLRTGNTAVPAGGIIIGSAPLPPPAEAPDPWAAPKPKGKVVAKGARIQMGKANNE